MKGHVEGANFMDSQRHFHGVCGAVLSGGNVKSRLAIVFALLIVVLVPGFGQNQPFSFIMLSDPQFGMYTQNASFVQETANYEFAVAAVNRLKPGFVIVLGDLVNKVGNPEQIKEFLRISGKIDSSIPAYFVAGNHDVGAVPTSQTIAGYRQTIGRDYFSFREGPVYGIVLDSSLIIAPQNAQAEYQEQLSWLEKELEKAKSSGVPNIIVFQHHPYFLENVDEPDQYWNIPVERRKPMLAMLHRAGVHYVFAGHLHKNVTVRDGDLEITATGPVGMPFGQDGSGIRLALITDKVLQHKYFEFGKMPDRLEIK
jgi:3',5'-cyclic AMP phosphodiesterase CpdA